MERAELRERLERATGADAELDRLLAEALGVPVQNFTGSLDACRALIADVLPGWRLHLGFDVTGAFPYAALGDGTRHMEAEAPALPLAALKAVLAALSAAG